MKKVIVGIIMSILLALSLPINSFAEEYCSMCHRTGEWYGGVDYYFDWYIIPAEKIISSWGNAAQYGLGNYSTNITPMPYSVDSTHFFQTFTTGGIDLSISIGNVISIGLGVGLLTFTKREEVALFFYKDFYEVMPLD